MRIIGIAGKMGSGKDYIASNIIIPYLELKLNQSCLPFCFADQIKINIMSKMNVPYHDVYIEKTNVTRNLLQQEGTENGRLVYGEDIWINYFDNWTKIFQNRGIKNIITTDCRFKNELQYIKNQGGIIMKINAPLRNEQRLKKESNGDDFIYKCLQTHSSECDLDTLDESEFDLIIDNDIGSNYDYSKLFEKLDSLL